MPENHFTRRDWLAATGSVAMVVLGLARSLRGVPTSNYEEKILAKKPIAYWRLGELKGTAAIDATKNRHDGEYHGTPILGRPGAIRHDDNTSIALDGKESYVDIPDHRDLSQPTSGKGLTIEAWMRPDVLEFRGETKDPYVFWLGKGAPGQHEWALRFYSRESSRPNRISAYIFNPAGDLGAGAYFEDKLTAGEWIHVVACYEPGDAESTPHAGVHIYKNGVHRLGPPSPGTLYNNPKWHIKPAHGTAPLRLGTRNLKSFFRGGLDEVAIYPRVLSADEIHENYVTGSGR